MHWKTKNNLAFAISLWSSLINFVWLPGGDIGNALLAVSWTANLYIWVTAIQAAIWLVLHWHD